MIRLKNNTKGVSKIGHCVQLDPRDPNAFVYASANATKVVGVVMESIPYRKLCKIATIGDRAKVYVSGNVIKGNILRTVKSGDRASLGTGMVAKSSDAPYFKIGEALTSGRGLISVVIDFVYIITEDLSVYIPYIGAINNVDLGLNSLTVSGITNNGDFITRDPWFDVRAYTSIANAIATIGATEGTLLIPDSNILGGDLVIPATLTLKIMQGGSITTTGHTLTINGPFHAGMEQVFVGTGTVVFGVNSAKEAYPQWWGGTATYGINQTTFIQAAIATGLPVVLSKGDWQCNIIITPTLSGNDYGSTTIRGEGIGVTNLYPYTNTNVIDINATSSMLAVNISNMTFKNSTAGPHTQLASAVAIKITTGGTESINDWHVFRDLEMGGFLYGLNIVGRTIWSEFTNIKIVNSLQHGVNVHHGEPSNALIWRNVCVQASEWDGFHIEQTSTNYWGNWVFELCTSEGNGLETLRSKNCGFYLKDIQNFNFINPSLELNGVASFDDSDAAFRIEGTYALNINIGNGFITGSNTGILCRAAFSSGFLDNNDIRHTDDAYHCIDILSTWGGTVNTRWTISKSNRFSPEGAADIFSTAVDVNGNYQHYAGGEATPFTWWTDATTPMTLNAYHNTDIRFNIATPVTIDSIINALPGQRITLTVHSASTAVVTLDSGIMSNASDLVIRQGDVFEFIVDAYPSQGKLFILNLGTARVEKEFVIPLDGFGKGAAKPAEVIVNSCLGYEFSINDLGYFSFEVPADWDSTEDIEISIHWYIDEAYALQSAEVQWAIIWVACSELGGEDPTAAGTTTLSGDVNIPATANTLIETNINIPAASLAQHDVLFLQIKRVALVGGTDPTAEPTICSLECEYISNRIGIPV